MALNLQVWRAGLYSINNEVTMKKLLIFTIVAFATLTTLVGCTDAEKASWGALGDAGHIVCYSGGKVIYEGDSTGKIATVDHSDGWEFKDANSGKFVRVSGQCLITN
jgi:hypothetical protein